ncbi:hypothetical protein CMUS01_00415 [Colletotrichum musicola]|uniref:Uncharacterized protein n=1 Tax=Colletotrichum musicola TaxID=2175873 RepID=A0A8H6NYV9_9PEZI|nr:hypothetical protein CMUS01_00415 [Colletotrichum musicola]
MVSAVPGSVKLKAPLIALRSKSIPRHHRRISPLSSPMHHETISRYLGARLNGVACSKTQSQGPARTGRAVLAPYSLHDGSHADGSCSALDAAFEALPPLVVSRPFPNVYGLPTPAINSQFTSSTTKPTTDRHSGCYIRRSLLAPLLIRCGFLARKTNDHNFPITDVRIPFLFRGASLAELTGSPLRSGGRHQLFKRYIIIPRPPPKPPKRSSTSISQSQTAEGGQSEGTLQASSVEAATTSRG